MNEGSAPTGDAAAGAFDTVIVPLDGSPVGEAVLPAATALAAATDAGLTLIRVVPAPEPPPGRPSHGPLPEIWSEPPTERTAAERAVGAYLADVRRRFALAHATPVVAVGDPFNRIRAEAARHRAPVIVLTAKATAALATSQDSLLARRLAFARICPVLVVPPTG
ncbi:MAG TPA: universal stress protein [Thermomicrobiales bacterium]|jgi:nucleotide-binding universal stress UspA family protein|nr:universal stress protein [Thermomicrobiales bacterium]